MAELGDVRQQRILPHAGRVGLAAALATLASHVAHLPDTWFATLAAIVAMQPTLHTSFRSARDSAGGAVGGALIGLAVAPFGGGEPWAIGLVVIVCLASAAWVRLDNVGVQAALVASVIVLMPSSQHLSLVEYSGVRLAQSLIGIGVALLVQLVFFPPRAQLKLRRELTWIYARLAGIVGRLGADLGEGQVGGLEPDADRHDLHERCVAVEARLVEAGRLWEEAMVERGHHGDLSPRWGPVTRRVVEQTAVLASATQESAGSGLLVALRSEVQQLVTAIADLMGAVAQAFDDGTGPAPCPDEVERCRAVLLDGVDAAHRQASGAPLSSLLPALTVVRALDVMARALVEATSDRP